MAAPSSALRTAARLFAEWVGFALLLFATRFVLRAHLVPLIDQECHIGGIAVDVLAHGIRFPLLAYAPNEYDNGSFFSGLLAAASFTLFGRNLLALKLVTHFISAAGAVAALSLLRAALGEAGIADRRARGTAVAVLLIAIAMAPRVVTLSSVYAVGNHAEGAALNLLLLAVCAWALRAGSPRRVALCWLLTGFAAYLNKAALLAIPAMAVVLLALPRGRWRNTAAALAGFGVGILPEVVVIAGRHGLGWTAMASKAERHAVNFPGAFLESLFSLADQRPALLVVWTLAVAAGAAIAAASLRGWKGRRRSGGASGEPPVAVALVTAFILAHLAALTVMAQGALDAYAIYSYAPLAILVALTAGAVIDRVARGRGARAALVTALAAIAIAAYLHRPDAVSTGPPSVPDLWRNRAGAACSWRFAEGFGREQTHGLTPSGVTREQHAIERCRSLSATDQQLDCIGGIARELHWRGQGRVPGGPPAALDPAERRAYAYAYGTHRFGDAAACADFSDPALAGECTAAVQLECLVFGDLMTRVQTGHGIGRPHCAIPESVAHGYWSEMRAGLLARHDGPGPLGVATAADTDLSRCATVFTACY